MGNEIIKDYNNKIDEKIKKLTQEIKKDFPEAKINYIEDDIYSVWDEKNIWFFTNEKREIYFNLETIWKSHYFEKWWFLAWYREVKNEKTWEYLMYKLWDLDVRWKPKPEAKAIDKYSLKYFETWVNIRFYDHVLWTITLLKKDDKWKYYMWLKEEAWDRHIISMINANALQISDLIQFKNQWQITEKTMLKYAKKIYLDKDKDWLTILQKQCSDFRFEKTWKQITIKELERMSFRFNNPPIPSDVLEDCKKRVWTRELEIKKMEREKQDLEIQKKLDVLRKEKKGWK